MKPLEIVDSLAPLSKKQQEKWFASEAPDQEHEFWVGVYYGATPFHKFPISFGIRDPLQFGDGVPIGVFKKILVGMESGKLSEEEVIDALTAFAHHCTEEEWQRWYRPILEKRLILPFSMSLFNRFCPKEYQVYNFRAPPPVPVTKSKGFPKEFFMEAYPPEAQRVFIFMKKNSARTFLDDGTEISMPVPKQLLRLSAKEGIIIEAFREAGDYLILRDLLLWEQLLDYKKTGPTGTRIGVLQSLCGNLPPNLPLEVADFHHCSSADDTANTRESFSLIIQQGYPGVIVRAIDLGYFDAGSNILVEPKKKSILTCTDIIEGDKGTKYEGAAEYIVGKGKLNKKTFETPVFHGLTFSQKETSLKEKDDLIGRKFEVVSCGLGPDNKLLFPIFKKWR